MRSRNVRISRRPFSATSKICNGIQDGILFIIFGVVQDDSEKDTRTKYEYILMRYDLLHIEL